MISHWSVSLLTLTLGGKEEDEGYHWLGDKAKEVRLQTPDIHNLEHGGDSKLVTQLGHHLGVGLQSRPPLSSHLGLCVSDLCHDDDDLKRYVRCVAASIFTSQCRQTP